MSPRSSLTAPPTGSTRQPTTIALAKLILGARVVLYPDAGHAFLFQEGTPFTSVIESSPAGSRPKPPISA